MLFLGSDHAGFELKKIIKDYLGVSCIKYEDLGIYKNDTDSNYSRIAEVVAKKVVLFNSYGIIFCGSGIGVSIASNKIAGARAALCFNKEYAKLARKHNNANIICLGGRMISPKEAIEMIDTFINTSFEAGRHLSRINYISLIERNKS